MVTYVVRSRSGITKESNSVSPGVEINLSYAQEASEAYVTGKEQRDSDIGRVPCM